MMLPTTQVSNSATSPNPLVVGVIGASNEVVESLTQISPQHISLLPLVSDSVNGDLIATLDALIGVIDGNLGLSPDLIEGWKIAFDCDLPRLILAINTVTGRADFDEVLALSELVLNEDIAIRYYPIEDDEQEKYIGLLDVLTHEIITPNTEPFPADPEHVNLTLDDHNELVELILHADLDQDLLEKHNSGMPISLPKLRELWLKVGLVTVLPIDQWISSVQISQWLDLLVPIWKPDVFESGMGKELEQCSDTLGIGVGLGIARVWPKLNQEKLVIVSPDRVEISLDKSVDFGLLLDSRIRPGDTIRPKHSNYVLAVPAN